MLTRDSTVEDILKQLKHISRPGLCIFAPKYYYLTCLPPEKTLRELDLDRFSRLVSVNMQVQVEFEGAVKSMNIDRARIEMSLDLFRKVQTMVNTSKAIEILSTDSG